jgi:hypothetical protein
MKRIFLILLFTLILQQIIIENCSAQQHDTAIKKDYIEIGAHENTQLPVNKINFNGVRFIDNRVDTSSIGYIIKQPLYRSGKNAMYGPKAFVKINFTNGLCTSLNNYFNIQLKNSFSELSDSLLVIVDHLRVSSIDGDDMEATHTQFIKLKLIMVKKHDGKLTQLRILDSLIRYKRKTFKKDFADCIKYTLKNIILKTSLQFSDSNNEEYVTEKEFYEKESIAVRGNIFRDLNLNIGVYANFSEVVANSPKYSSYYMRYEDSINYDILVYDGNREIYWNDIWGYCDGKNIYVHAESNRENYYPLIREGNSLTISLKPANFKVKEKASRSAEKIASGVMLIPAVLSHGAASGSPGNFSNIEPPKIYDKISKREYEIEGACINMQTGEIDF